PPQRGAAGPITKFPLLKAGEMALVLAAARARPAVRVAKSRPRWMGWPRAAVARRPRSGGDRLGAGAGLRRGWGIRRAGPARLAGGPRCWRCGWRTGLRG